MNLIISSLFIAPVVVSGLLLLLPKSLSKILVILTAIALSAVSVYLYVSIDDELRFSVPAYVDKLVAGADIFLLLFFGWVAFNRKSWLVGIMSVLQLAALLYLLSNMHAGEHFQFFVDKLSLFMFLLINVISGVIAVYSLQYIQDEKCSPFRRKYFLSILFWFIAVMNLIVASDNLEYFFLFFELTTLASFLLIGFRNDRVSRANAVTALWMNQVGGLAILIAIFFIVDKGYGAATFTSLLAHVPADSLLLPLALLSVAALIKGAQMPFSKWLLGAMVAPTPVSALLHSSTMVKIAPFIILRLSPALKDTPVASVIIGLTGFVFVASAISALSQDNLKRILAHSTIALLALMIMMAAVGTQVTIIASLTLVLFHGISKCLLFLNAGVLEKVFHYKNASDMDRLGQVGPFTSFAVTIGFMSLLLPPFGAFIGKWFSIEALGSLAVDKKIMGALVIVAVACGGAVLSLLYFKVAGLLLTRTGEKDRLGVETTKPLYRATLFILIALVILAVPAYPFLVTDYLGVVTGAILGTPVDIVAAGWRLQIGAVSLPIVPLLISFVLFPLTIIAAMFVRFRNVDRVKEYACGEKINYSFSSFYFSTDKAMPYFSIVGLIFFIVLITVALV